MKGTMQIDKESGEIFSVSKVIKRYTITIPANDWKHLELGDLVKVKLSDVEFIKMIKQQGKGKQRTIFVPRDYQQFFPVGSEVKIYPLQKTVQKDENKI